MDNTIRTEVKTNTATIWRDGHGIFHLEYDPDAYVTKDDIEENRQAVLSISSNPSNNLIVLSGSRFKGFSKEAREYVTSEEMGSTYKASAAIASNHLLKVVTSFFLGYNKPLFHYKVFTNEEDGVKWLRTFL